MPIPPSFLEPVGESALAEARKFNATLEDMLSRQPSVHTIPPEVTRRVRREGRGIFPPPTFLASARDRTIPGRAGPVKVRALAPSDGRTPAGVYLHFHGGGWTFGAADMQDLDLQALADATGLLALSVDYRLAPENPYPAALHDCVDAALWLVNGGARELGAPERLLVGGESAGAHLTALTLIALRDEHKKGGAFRAANLVYGGYDLSMTPSQRSWGDRNLVISVPIIRFFGDCFLPGIDLEARRAPSISPLFADLRDMPPALFTVGTLDPLIDDTLFMHARWRAAGATAELRVWPEGIHGFTMYPIAIGRAALAAAYAFLVAA